MNKRIFVEKKPAFRVEAENLKRDLNENLGLNLTSVKLLNIYDIFDISEGLLEKALYRVFAEKPTDTVYTEGFSFSGAGGFAYESRPGQFDQRSDSAEKCLKLIEAGTEAKVVAGKLILFGEKLSDADLKRVKDYCINPVECCEKDLSVLENTENVAVQNVPVYDGFRMWDDKTIAAFREEKGLAMSSADLCFVRDYFRKENRDPNDTEIRMLDTYWSDHCRHTTFETLLTDVTFPSDGFGRKLQQVFEDYLAVRTSLKRQDKPMTLMDLATVNAKWERSRGNLDDLEISDEINACSVFVDVDVDGKTEKYLLMFKNETHNHPTEIEPFGGASTCLGGAIRDPLSGRSYVYQAMRLSGAGDITRPVSETREGKLPQKIISKKAAAGFSSYGNQIGLATTYVKEIFDEGFVAKRMEVGAVVGAAKAENVRRSAPEKGDVVILLGGRTGRDGIGGATGSSKEHTENSLKNCFAEVQKGNAPEERKLQRLMRDPRAARLIKKANDFGAGGVSVAIGELADGLEIFLDRVPLKYRGLNATEIAISESQERMAAVVAEADAAEFLSLAARENLEAVVVANVTDNNRLVMYRDGKKVVDLDRDFINSAGVRQRARVCVGAADRKKDPFRVERQEDFRAAFLNNLKELNHASQQGLKEMFDSTIGATTVLLPYGGRYQKTESIASVQKIPLEKGETETCSVLTYGYQPKIASYSPYHGAQFAITESMAKIVCCGGDYRNIRFTFQEYFEKLGDCPEKWGKPFAALLGAFDLLKAFGLAAIGGKDSMSGTYRDLHVPPTLISFAVATQNVNDVLSNELKETGSYLYLLRAHRDEWRLPIAEELKKNWDLFRMWHKEGKILSAEPVGSGGIAKTLCNMAFGNRVGFRVETDRPFDTEIGSIVIESRVPLTGENAEFLGRTENGCTFNGQSFGWEELLGASESTFASVYPITAPAKEKNAEEFFCDKKYALKPNFPWKGVRVLIPVFPGTNCDYDSKKAFESLGAAVRICVFRNGNADQILSSVEELAEEILNCNILMFAGGFSAGDEPDGSGKFIASVINQEKVKKAIEILLERNGLILGICNGFQALIKSGLLPYGKIGEVSETSATLFRNDINRHVSKIVSVKTSGVCSPWLSEFRLGEVCQVAVSHGEGKFVASAEEMRRLKENGQICFRYCDADGNVSMDEVSNPNGSAEAVEGICSPCGRILGKMGHSERSGNGLYKNYPGFHSQSALFIGAVKYFEQEGEL